MNRDQIMASVFVLIAVAIFFFFQTMREEKIWNENIRFFKESVIDSKRPRVISFTSPYSAPCQQFKPVLKKVMDNYLSSVDCQIVNIDDKQNTKLVHAFAAKSIPATYVFDRKGNLLLKQMGYMEPDDLESVLRKAVL